MSTGSKPRLMVTLGIGLVAAMAVIYFIIDPAEMKWMPRCLFLTLTGWQCPGCGSQRMLHALLHGEIAEAWSYNPFFVALLPVLLFLLWLETRRKRNPKLYVAVYAPRNIIIATLIIIAWGVVRNILGC